MKHHYTSLTTQPLHQYTTTQHGTTRRLLNFGQAKQTLMIEVDCESNLQFGEPVRAVTVGAAITVIVF